MREAGIGYIDKSSFISHLLDDINSVALFPRPRRFGKTLNLSMLGYFLLKSEENLYHMFDGLEVTRARAMVHFQKYPTVSVTFKDVKADALSGPWWVFASKSFRHSILIGTCSTIQSSVRPRRVSSEACLMEPISVDELQYSFKWLTQILHQHHETPVVVLVDEYDTPIQSGYMYGYIELMVLFFRNFFSGVFNDNVSLFKGVLTGILRVSKENLFSGLRIFCTEMLSHAIQSLCGPGSCGHASAADDSGTSGGRDRAEGVRSERQTRRHDDGSCETSAQ